MGAVKVLAFPPAYLPARVGAWIATHGFLARLAALGHEVTVMPLARSLAHRRGTESVIDGVRVVSFDEAEFGAPDVVVSHATGAGTAADAAEKLGVPHVRFLHGAGSAVTSHSDLIVCCSHAAAAGVEGPVLVCHPPTWADDHMVDETGDAVTIVNCSRAKGIDTAWRAAERLPGVKFLGVMGGYGDQRKPRLRHFKIIGQQQDMRTVWARTRVLLMPSEHEAWGMVGVEAMCSGIPVIAHPTDGLRESLGDAGIFVDRNDVDGWVGMIRRLEDPDFYAEASAAASARFAELDPQAEIDRFVAAVEALCS